MSSKHQSSKQTRSPDLERSSRQSSAAASVAAQGLNANRTGYNSSSSLYGGDLSAADDTDLDSYWKKGASKKKKNKQNGAGGGGAAAGGQQASKKKQHKAHTPAGFQNLGYGNIDESTSLVFSVQRVTGRCQDLEKDYLRLTSQADPDRVRPPAVLQRSLTMVKRKWIDANESVHNTINNARRGDALGARVPSCKGDQVATSNPLLIRECVCVCVVCVRVCESYEYCCNQLKAIRQDLTVQHIKDALTVEVYETHARIALESLDFQEFAQSVGQRMHWRAGSLKI